MAKRLVTLIGTHGYSLGDGDSIDTILKKVEKYLMENEGKELMLTVEEVEII